MGGSTGKRASASGRLAFWNEGAGHRVSPEGGAICEPLTGQRGVRSLDGGTGRGARTNGGGAEPGEQKRKRGRVQGMFAQAGKAPGAKPDFVDKSQGRQPAPGRVSVVAAFNELHLGKGSDRG